VCLYDISCLLFLYFQVSHHHQSSLQSAKSHMYLCLSSLRTTSHHHRHLRDVCPIIPGWCFWSLDVGQKVKRVVITREWVVQYRGSRSHPERARKKASEYYPKIVGEREKKIVRKDSSDEVWGGGLSPFSNHDSSSGQKSNQWKWYRDQCVLVKIEARSKKC